MDEKVMKNAGMTRDKFDAAMLKVLDITKESEHIQAFHDASMTVIFADDVATDEECADYWAELRALLPNLRDVSPF